MLMVCGNPTMAVFPNSVGVSFFGIFGGRGKDQGGSGTPAFTKRGWLSLVPSDL
jgi:hypothetical protein